MLVEEWSRRVRESGRASPLTSNDLLPSVVFLSLQLSVKVFELFTVTTIRIGPHIGEQKVPFVCTKTSMAPSNLPKGSMIGRNASSTLRNPSRLRRFWEAARIIPMQSPALAGARKDALWTGDRVPRCFSSANSQAVDGPSGRIWLEISDHAIANIERAYRFGARPSRNLRLKIVWFCET